MCVLKATLFVLLYVCVLVSQSNGSLQGYAVKGRLLCGSAPASKVKVKLIDIDFGVDDTMDSKSTDAQGNFMLQGQTSETTTIDPVLKIYHDCNDGWKPGQRRWKMDLPKKYVKQGTGQPTVVDVGILNLEPKMHEEERDFI